MINTFLSYVAFISNHIIQFFSSPYLSVIFLLFLAIIVIAALVTLIVFSNRKKQRQKQRTEKNIDKEQSSRFLISKFQNDEKAQLKDFQVKEKKKLLNPNKSKNNFFKRDPLIDLFKKTLRFLKTQFGPIHYQYQLPWFLLLGAESSGKSELLSSLNQVAISIPTENEISDHLHSKCQFCFLKGGVILDLLGSVFSKKNSIQSEDCSWKTMHVLLQRFRSSSPLQGIILTFAIDEFYGKNQKSDEELSERASFFSQKLTQLQSNLGLRLTIYVLLTKTDLIPGFKYFAKHIPSRFLHNMLGWSSPYTPSEAYTPLWFDRAFLEIQESLYQIQHEILKKVSEREDSSFERDELFLFPRELFHIKNKVSIYINSLFQDTHPDSPLFRGLYFCGDAGSFFVKNEESSVLPKTTQNRLLLQKKSTSKKHNIVFVSDLFHEKIFKESKLSHPIPRMLSTSVHRLKIAKTVVAFIFICGVFGAFNAHNHFLESSSRLIPLISKMNSAILEFKNADTISDLGILSEKKYRAVFEDYSSSIIQMMDDLHSISFFSVFIPYSWTSPIKEKLFEVLSKSYQETILKSIYMDLLVKADHLFDTSISVISSQEKEEPFGLLLDPLKSEPYVRIKNYFIQVKELNTQINRFNSLKSTSNLEDLNALMLYTFNSEIPKEYWNKSDRICSFLKKMNFPPINVIFYGEKAKETLKKLHENLILTLFSDQHLSIVGKIVKFINKLNQSRFQNCLDVEYLQKFSSDFTKIMLPTPGQNWIDQPYFMPGPDYTQTMAYIAHDSFFGKELAQSFIDQTSLSFKKFQELLSQKNNYFAKEPKRKKVAYPSQGIYDLQTSLKLLMDEPYMSIPLNCRFTSVIPAGHIVDWDPYLIQIACDMAKRYEEFMSKHIHSFPLLLQENVTLFSKINLQAHIKSLLARSQRFVKVSHSYKPFRYKKNFHSIEKEDLNLHIEESLYIQIDDVKETFPIFLNLLELMNFEPSKNPRNSQQFNQNFQGNPDIRLNLGSDFIEIRNFLWKIAYKILQDIDKIFTNLSPFATNLNFWDGTPHLALKAYGVSDLDDLKALSDLTEQQAIKLSLEFAKPVIHFLNSSIMLDFNHESALVQKWRRIIASLETHQKKRFSSSFTNLKNFILLKLDHYDVASVLDELGKENPKTNFNKTNSEDYFTCVLLNLKHQLLEKAEILKRRESISNYEDLRLFFNTNLRDRFPFVGNAAPIDGANALPEVIRDFFKKFDEYGGSAAKILDQVYQLGNAQEAYRFLEYLEDIKTFFYSYLHATNIDILELDHTKKRYKNNSLNLDYPKFDLNFDFRVNRKHEKSGDYIMDWGALLDGVSVINNPQKIGQWMYGKGIDITFRYPPSSKDIPMKDPSFPFLELDSSAQRVVFRYPKPWGLFWLLRLHADSITPIAGGYCYVLKFTIPLENGRRSVVFNRLTIIQMPLDDDMVGKPLKVPYFPVIAPSLPLEIKRFMNQPVLTQKKYNRSQK